MMLFALYKSFEPTVTNKVKAILWSSLRQPTKLMRKFPTVNQS